MKRLLIVALFLVVASMPAYANIQCYPNIDSQPYDDGYMSFCYLSGSFCVYCVDFTWSKGCAAHTICDTGGGPKGGVPKSLLARLSPAKGNGRAQVAAARRGRTSTNSYSSSNRPVSMRVGRLNAGNLL